MEVPNDEEDKKTELLRIASSLGSYQSGMGNKPMVVGKKQSQASGQAVAVRAKLQATAHLVGARSARGAS